jgi:HK97 family phage prohead protease
VNELEVRSFVEPVEFRSEGGKITAHGTAIRYGALSRKFAGGIVERVMPGAPVKALEHRNINAYHEHPHPGVGGYDKLLGTTDAGTMRLRNDDVELRYEIDLPDTTAGRDAAVLLERGDLRGASYGFLSKPGTDRWTRGKDGLALRSVHEMSVFDHIVLTCNPAYPSSTAELALRSLADASGLEMASLLDAAEHRALADLIDSVDDRDDTGTDDDVVEIPIRRRIASLYL